LHSEYLCLKILATFGVISIFDSQKDTQNIEQDLVLSHKNVHFLREETDQQVEWPVSKEAMAEFKKAIEAEGDFRKVGIDPRVPDKAVCLGSKTSLEK
jgi:hypothetical protein